MWVEERLGKRVNLERTEEALRVEADVVGTACSFCLTTFEDGLRPKDATEKVRALDVVELVSRVLDGACDTARAPVKPADSVSQRGEGEAEAWRDVRRRNTSHLFFRTTPRHMPLWRWTLRVDGRMVSASGRVVKPVDHITSTVRFLHPSLKVRGSHPLATGAALSAAAAAKDVSMKKGGRT